MKASKILLMLVTCLTILSCSSENERDLVAAAAQGNIARIKELFDQKTTVNVRAIDVEVVSFPHKSSRQEGRT